MRLGRPGAGDLVVAALLFRVAPNAVMQIGPDAPASAGLFVAPGKRHLITGEDAAPVRLRVQIECAVAAGGGAGPWPCLARVGIQQKWNVPGRKMVMTTWTKPGGCHDLGHPIAFDERG